MPVQFRPDRVREMAQSRWVRSEQFRSWLLRRRWFGFRSPEGLDLDVVDSIPFASEGEAFHVTILLEATSGGRRDTYHIPLRLSGTEPRGADRFLASIANQRAYGSEGEAFQSYTREVAKLATTRARLRSHRGRAVEFDALQPLPMGSSFIVASEETSHILVRLEGSQAPVLMKSYKRIDGANREPRMLEHLTRVGFPNAPRYLGGVVMRGEGQVLPLSLFLEFLQGTENLFNALVAEVGRALGQGEAPLGDPLAATLGGVLAKLHGALVSTEDPLFRPETILEGYLTVILAEGGEYQREAHRLADNLKATLEAQWIDPGLLEILEEDDAFSSSLQPLEGLLGSPRIQTHQDLHLAQVLRRQEDGTLYFIDFEGEPIRSPQEKWRKDTPLRDLATLERSFAYVKHYVLRSLSEDRGPEWSMAFLRQGPRAPLVEGLDRWEASMVRSLEEAYLRTMASANARLLPSDVTTIPSIVRALALEKALYEVRYELAHRPGNVAIPLEGLHNLLNRGPRGG